MSSPSRQRVLTINGGSSSLKVALFEVLPMLRKVSSANVSRIGLSETTLKVEGEGPAKQILAHDLSEALDAILAALGLSFPLSDISAVGHRVVHGGDSIDAAKPVSDEILTELRKLAPLDPDHMPSEIALIERIRDQSPDVFQVVCCDTVFHRTIPRVARLLAIPLRFEKVGIRRFGFHGLSYTFLMQELERVAGDEAAKGRVILAHLGSGASLAAVRDGRSVDTTMGFTPTSGIPMGTRPGDLDPGVIIQMMRNNHLGADALEDLLNHQSGLLGLSETSSDMVDLLKAEACDTRAKDAVEVFCREARKAVGALATVLGGVDTLLFSGGIGAKSSIIRARISAGLEHLGIDIEESLNSSGASIISSDRSRCTVRVMQTDEESIIAQQACEVVGAR